MGVLEDLGLGKLLREGERVARRVPRRAPGNGGLVVVALSDRAMTKPALEAAKEIGLSCFCFSFPEGAIVFASADEDRLDDVLSAILGNYDGEQVSA